MGPENRRLQLWRRWNEWRLIHGGTSRTSEQTRITSIPKEQQPDLNRTRIEIEKNITNNEPT